MALQLGIDFGGTTVKIGLVNDQYQILERVTLPTGASTPFAEMVQLLVQAIRTLPADAIKQVEHIGVGVPSSIVRDTRVVVYAGNLGWRNCDLVGEMGRYFDCAIDIANDADCAAYGEALAGAGREYGYMMMLTLGTGVGGGVIDHGRIFLGGNGCGIEPGHMTIVENGLPCTCGRLGCLECYASATAMIREIHREAETAQSGRLRDMIAANGGKANAQMAFEAAGDGDIAAQRILERYIHSLAVGISNLVTLLRPEVIVLGGGVSNAGKALFMPLREQVCAMTYGVEIMGCPPILPAMFGNDAGIIGAAFLYQQS